MAKRYQGNSGRVSRLEEAPPLPRMPEPVRVPPPPPPPARRPGLFERLGSLLPGARGELETEDLLLLMILYLLYRESGDSELLLILGAVFLL